ncbi:hypothetical protein HDU97_003130 [Phlyctochytrium planicorne]|nr:hypothetical protein HDU97_003081 [Phlyctochytrium planicorne]KAJ3109700.1 hypothetical protein HDU97_003130 [Phlyctochytrium planicorne]
MITLEEEGMRIRPPSRQEIGPDVTALPSLFTSKGPNAGTFECFAFTKVPSLICSGPDHAEATLFPPAPLSNLKLLDALGGHNISESDAEEERLLEEFSKKLRSSMRTKNHAFWVPAQVGTSSKHQKLFDRAVHATKSSTKKSEVPERESDHGQPLLESPTTFVSLENGGHSGASTFTVSDLDSRLSSSAGTYRPQLPKEDASTFSLFSSTSTALPLHTGHGRFSPSASEAENASTTALLQNDHSRPASRVDSFNSSLFVLQGSPSRIKHRPPSSLGDDMKRSVSPSTHDSPANLTQPSSTRVSSPIDPDYLPAEDYQSPTSHGLGDDVSEFQVHTLSYPVGAGPESIGVDSNAQSRSSPALDEDVSEAAEHILVRGVSHLGDSANSTSMRVISGLSSVVETEQQGAHVMENATPSQKSAFTALTSPTSNPPPQPIFSSPQRPPSPPLNVDILKNSVSSESISEHHHSARKSPRSRSSSPSHPPLLDQSEMQQRLSSALADVDRYRDALSRAKSDLIARDAEIDKIKWEQRRTEEDFLEEKEGLLNQIHKIKMDFGAVADGLRRESEDKVRQADARHAVTIEELKFKLHESLSRNLNLENELADVKCRLEDVGKSREEQSRLIEVLKDLKAENTEYRELLEQEKAKNARAEDEFRMFSRKLRNLQDSNSGLRTENEQLRLDLRKLQYEAGANDESKFYKERLEQALYDVESLKALSKSLSEQNDSLRNMLETRSGISSFSNEGHSSPSSQRFPSYNYGDSSPGRHGLRRPASAYQLKSAWDSGPRDPYEDTVSESDKSRFQQKMRMLEQDSTNPTDPFLSQNEPDNESSVMPNFNRSIGAGSQAIRRSSNPLTWAEPPSPLARTAGSVSASSTPKLRVRNSSESVAALLSGTVGDKSISDYAAVKDDLERQLKNLMDQKGALTGELQRIPTSGTGSGFRKKQEDIDNKLDEVERQIGALKMKMRNMHML